MANAYLPETHRCAYCGNEGPGNYCNNCGREYRPERISLGALLSDVVQQFTSMDLGFLFTIRKLATAPGQMQWDYIHRDRHSYQKPFSMLFISATMAALIRFWIFQPNKDEAAFYNEYWVFLHLGLIPVYILATRILFLRSGYNLAETGVLIMYLFSFLFLVAGIATFFRLLIPNLDTVLIELPFSLIYFPLSFANFFRKEPKLWSILKSLVILLIILLITQKGEDLAYKILY